MRRCVVAALLLSGGAIADDLDEEDLWDQDADTPDGVGFDDSARRRGQIRGSLMMGRGAAAASSLTARHRRRRRRRRRGGAAATARRRHRSVRGARASKRAALESLSKGR